MKLLGYTRVSRVGERDPEMLRSPDQQRDAILGYAKNNPSGVKHEVVWLEPDLDESGKDLDRPAMRKALRMIRAGEVDGLIAARLDRVTRSVSDLDHLMKASKAEGWNVVAIDMGLDSSTANGQLVWQMLGAINEWFLNRSRENWNTARADAIRRGNHVGAHAPFGYRKRPKTGQLEPDPVTAPVVTEIFQRRAAGESVGNIWKWCRREAVRMQFGGPVTGSAVRKILMNEVYLGVLHDRGSGTRLEGAHPPLSDVATFAACQRSRGARQATGETRLLTGLLRCAGCRYTMQSDQTQWGAAYRCSRQRRAGDCPEPAFIKAEGVTRLFGDGVEQWLVEQVFARAPDVTLQPFGAGSGVAELAADVQAAKAEAVRYASDSALEEALGREAYLAGAGARRHAVDVAEQAYELALAEQGQAVGEKVRRLREVWEELSLAERRDALATVVTAIFVRAGRHSHPKILEAQELLETEPDLPGARIARLTGTSRHTVNELREDLRNGQRRLALADRVQIVWVDGSEVDVPRQGRRGWVHPTPFVFADAHPDHVRVALG